MKRRLLFTTTLIGACVWSALAATAMSTGSSREREGASQPAEHGANETNQGMVARITVTGFRTPVYGVTDGQETQPSQASSDAGAMSEAEFLRLAQRYIPTPEPEYGIDYKYLVVSGTVEDIRVGGRAQAARRPEPEAFGIATIKVEQWYTTSAHEDNTPTFVDLALMHSPYYDADGDAVYRGRGDGSEPFDRFHREDFIIAVAVRTSHPMGQKVLYSGASLYTSVFSVVQDGDAPDSAMAVISAIKSTGDGLLPEGDPWTLVEPSIFERVFTYLPLRAEKVFDMLIAVVDSAVAQ